jgi:cysteine-rich repeat protein
VLYGVYARVCVLSHVFVCLMVWSLPVMFQVTFWRNQSILVSTPMFSVCEGQGASAMSHAGNCIFGLYDDASVAILSFPFQLNSSTLLTGLAQIPASAPYQTSAKGSLLVLNFEMLQYFGLTCEPDIFAYNAGRANFSSVIFGSGSYGWGAPATKVFTSQSDLSSAVAIPVVSISQADTWSVISAFSLEYVSGFSSIHMLQPAVNTTLPIVSNERSDRAFTHEDVSYFSSRGPTTDLRHKPDVVAPGQDIFSANSDGRPGSFQCGASLGEVNSSVLMMSGTSMAAPGVAGAAALVRQYYEQGFHANGAKNPDAGFQPSSALVKGSILHAGTQIRFQKTPFSPSPSASSPGMFDHSSTRNSPRASRRILDHESQPPAAFSWSPGAQSPSFEQGYGLIDLSSVLPFADSLFEMFPFDRQLINHSSYLDFCFATSGTPDARFRASLVWTDPPGFPHAARALVNNLDLSVIADYVSYDSNTVIPDYFFYGNAPNSGARYLDTDNNAEQITLERLSANSHIIVRVAGTDIPEGPQAFSLLVTGPIHRIDCPEGAPAACENECSGHGTCTAGICSCVASFAGASCGIVECGNGRVSDSEGEQCDDGNNDDGDGCSSECLVEDGFRCQQLDVRYPSVCAPCECGCHYYR